MVRSCCAISGGVAEELQEGASAAAEAIDSGKAKAALETLVFVSNQS